MQNIGNYFEQIVYNRFKIAPTSHYLKCSNKHYSKKSYRYGSLDGSNQHIGTKSNWQRRYLAPMYKPATVLIRNCVIIHNQVNMNSFTIQYEYT